MKVWGERLGGIWWTDGGKRAEMKPQDRNVGTGCMRPGYQYSYAGMDVTTKRPGTDILNEMD